MRRLLLISFALLVSIVSEAQTSAAKDSLLQLFSAAQTDTVKVKLLLQLAKITKNSDISASYQYGSQALSLSRKVGYNAGIFKSLLHDISLTRIEGKDSLALVKCKNLIDETERAKDTFFTASAYLTSGETFNNNGDNEKGIEFIFKGLRIAEKMKVKSLMQDAYSSLQRIYVSRSEFDKAIQYGKLAIDLAKEMNDKGKVATQSYNLAYTYNLTKDFDKSLAVSKHVLEVSREIGDQRIECYTLYNFCAIYLRTGALSDALKYGLESLAIAQKTSDRSVESSIRAALGSIYLQLKDYNTAETYAAEALSMREKTEDKLGIIEVKSILGDIYYAKGEPIKAYALKMETEDFQDAYNQSVLSKQSSDLEKKYETQRKEAQIKLQQTELKQKTTVNYFLTAGIAGILIISFLGYRNYRSRQKLQQSKIDELESEKKLTAAEAVIKGEEQERTRLAKDLHDGLGGMLSGIKHSFSSMKGNMVLTAENARAFERSMNMLDSSISEMRRVAHNMMPEVLVKYGLDAALKEFCNSIDESGVIRVNYQSVDMNETEIEQTKAITAYRIVQELVNNAIKHAQANTVIVQLHYLKNEKQISLTVEDNGKGFDAAILNHQEGMGWRNIQNRIEFLKGKADVNTSPGTGCSVHIEMEA